MLAPLVDDANLMDVHALRRIRLLLERLPEEPQPRALRRARLLHTLALTVNDDIKSRVTYSVVVQRLAPEDVPSFILGQLDRVALAHSTFTEDALALIVRASEGILRAARNICLAALLEAVPDRVRHVDLPEVNRVLLQPRWRREQAPF